MSFNTPLSFDPSPSFIWIAGGGPIVAHVATLALATIPSSSRLKFLHRLGATIGSGAAGALVGSRLPHWSQFPGLLDSFESLLSLWVFSLVLLLTPAGVLFVVWFAAFSASLFFIRRLCRGRTLLLPLHLCSVALACLWVATARAL